MNKEEKEAIKTLKNIVIQEYDWWIDKGDYAESNVKEANDAIKTILDLYQKEKEKNKKLEIYENVINNREYTWKQKYEETFDYVKDEFVSKDKIREKIKELNELQKKSNLTGLITEYQIKIQVLEELLGE